jgi:hypothetical protein
MTSWLLALFLAGPAPAADADKATLKMVEFFIKAPVSELPPDHIEEFLAVDPDTLPKKLREPYKGKRLELYTLKQLSAGKKKGFFRMPEQDCAIPKDAKSNDIKALKFAGYEEIPEDEKDCVEKITHCNEHQLMCEFTLQIVIETVGKKKKERVRHIFLHQNDPLMAVVAQCRAGVGGQTNFFGTLKPSCAH